MKRYYCDHCKKEFKHKKGMSLDSDFEIKSNLLPYKLEVDVFYKRKKKPKSDYSYSVAPDLCEPCKKSIVAKILRDFNKRTQRK